MKFLEKDLEEIIYNADKDLLSEKGLLIDGRLKRQLRIGNFGVADLVEFRRPRYDSFHEMKVKGEIIVYELKQNKIGISAFLQALGYIQGIKSYLSEKGVEEHYNYTIKLIGKEIDINSTFCYLPNFLPRFKRIISIYDYSIFSLCCYTYDYDVDGIKFKRIYGYNLTNKGF